MIYLKTNSNRQQILKQVQDDRFDVLRNLK